MEEQWNATSDQREGALGGANIRTNRISISDLNDLKRISNGRAMGLRDSFVNHDSLLLRKMSGLHQTDADSPFIKQNGSVLKEQSSEEMPLNLRLQMATQLSQSTRHSPSPSQTPPTPVVPKIVHITWFFPPNTEFRFHHAVCLLSVQRYFHPTKILFWHSAMPTGRWWIFVRQSVAHLLPVPYEPPTKVFNRSVAVPEHQSDVARLELLETYGGLYVDLDVILVRPLDPLLV